MWHLLFINFFFGVRFFLPKMDSDFHAHFLVVTCVGGNIYFPKSLNQKLTLLELELENVKFSTIAKLENSKDYNFFQQH